MKRGWIRATLLSSHVSYKNDGKLFYFVINRLFGSFLLLLQGGTAFGTEGGVWFDFRVTVRAVEFLLP